MDDKIQDADEKDELESFDVNLNKDPIRQGKRKFLRYTALAILLPCATFLYLQTPARFTHRGIIPFMGFKINFVVVIITLFALYIAVRYRPGY